MLPDSALLSVSSAPVSLQSEVLFRHTHVHTHTHFYPLALGCAGSSFPHGLPSSCGASHRGGVSCCEAWALGYVGFSSCGDSLRSCSGL